MRHQGLFIVVILCLTLGLQHGYHLLTEHYSDRKELQKQLSVVQTERSREKLERSLVENQLDDLKSQVAQHLGRKTQLAWNEKQWWMGVRSPASVDSERLNRAPSASLLAGAKEDFRNRQFSAATEKLRELIAKYPVSPNIVEAHFLMAESLFVGGQVEASLDVIDQMMTQFPDSELTGFIMLRMAQVLKARNRAAEAREIYETVRREFPKSDELQRQTAELLKNLKTT